MWEPPGSSERTWENVRDVLGVIISYTYQLGHEY